MRLGGPSWFRLGDRDVALHVLRTERLRRGERLTEITADVCRRLGIKARVLPMTDAAVRTIVHTPHGPLPFQEYFVKERCAPAVTGFAFAGSENAAPTPELDAALADRDLAAIVLCPSNPYVSIAPILAVPGLKQRLKQRGVPIVAVSPIIGGAAVKGPAAKMMRELGIEPSAVAVAEHYRGFIDGFLLDEADAALLPRLAPLAARAVPSLMKTTTDRRRLAEAVVEFAAEIAGGR
jgi:LPPG:FO 2-phospho-L-lactate transferase